MKNIIGTTKTKIINNEQNVIVRYHTTDVISFNQDKIVLNSGGWRTKTTKLRINQTSSKYNLGISVYQKKYEWYVNYNDKEVSFEDNMVLDRK